MTCAEGRNRTGTRLPSQPPQDCVSTSSTTSARTFSYSSKSRTDSSIFGGKDSVLLCIELFSEAKTFGIFQMESAGMRSYVKELKPQNIVEIAAMVALYRPGPMEQIPNYIDVKHRRSTPKYLHDDLYHPFSHYFSYKYYKNGLYLLGSLKDIKFQILVQY